MLEFFSGSSTAVSPASAMRECLSRALGNDDPGGCSLLIIHSTIGHNARQLLAAARALCPASLIVGCSASGIIGREGVTENMRALAVMAVRGKEVAAVYGEGINGRNSREVAREAAERLVSQRPGVNFIYVLAPGLDIAGDSVINGIEEVFGSDVPVFGATAADNGKAKGTFQFFDDTVSEHRLIVVGFADPSIEAITAAHHGSVPLEGVTFTVTASNANQVIELDGEPAWTRLMASIGLPPVSEPAETLPITGMGIELPEAEQSTYFNRHIIRVPIRVDDEHRSFYLPACCPVGTELTLMQRDERYIFDGVDGLIGRLQTMLGGSRPLAVLHADCMARGRLMFDGVAKDEIIGKMQNPLRGEADIPWLGIYGYSEFCRVGERNRLHSYTTSLCLLVRRDPAEESMGRVDV
jgi:hypothetical protein